MIRRLGALISVTGLSSSPEKDLLDSVVLLSPGGVQEMETAIKEKKGEMALANPHSFAVPILPCPAKRDRESVVRDADNHDQCR